MKSYIRFAALVLVSVCSSLQAQQLLSGVTELRFQAATSVATGPRSVTFQNVRARSTSTTLDDYLEIDYKADLATLQMRPSTVRVFKGVGPYNIEDRILMKDVPSTFSCKKPDGTVFSSNTNSYVSVTSDGTKPIVLSNLTAGMSLTMQWRNLSGAFRYVLTGPGEGKPTVLPAAIDTGASAGWIHPENVILKSGNYNLWVAPAPGNTSLSFTFAVGNENTSSAAFIKSGESFSASLSSLYRNYVKRKVAMKAGQLLRVTFSGVFGTPNCSIFKNDGSKVSSEELILGSSSIGAYADVDDIYFVTIFSAIGNLQNSQSAGISVSVTVN